MTSSLPVRFGGVVVLAFFGCGRADAPKPTIAPITEGSTAPASTAGASVSGAPTFTYDEGTATLSFWDTGATRIVVREGGVERACDSELGEKGNLWTRSDVDAAFHAPDVQKALGQHELYRAAHGSRARLTAKEGTIDWVIVWKEIPPNEPDAVHHLQEVLHVVLTNRVSLCP